MNRAGRHYTIEKRTLSAEDIHVLRMSAEGKNLRGHDV
jgi:hypothetical protein